MLAVSILLLFSWPAQTATASEHERLGRTYEAKGDLGNAAAELERSAAISPNQADVHYHLSRIYDRMGQSDKAAEQRELHKRLTASSEVK